MIPIRKNHQAAFTLIELMIVIAIIAFIAAIAIPSFLRAKIAANESGAIQTLRSLFTAEEELRLADIIDQDADGSGEYGFFQELCGKVAPPGHAAPVLPEFFDPVFGVMNGAGAASRAGYHFKIYLPGPGAAGPPVGETGGSNSASANQNEIDMREVRWVCYAWPMAHNFTARRAFALNQDGIIFVTKAMVTTYDSTNVIPQPQAAYAPGSQNLKGTLANGVGTDGNTWRPSD
ncbi:MAG: hypothetical protein AMS15_00375 [Planctomycetes bacterium DG_23]|nr:MAG: hypothetical protein AMS15_00375 [Planctomycetes bacterium DG_23]